MNPRRPAVLLLGDTLNVGGTEGQFTELACGLDRSRWDVQVCCVRAEGPLRARLEAAGLHPTSVGPSSFRSPSLLAAVWRLARLLRSHSIRVVHCFDFYSNILGVSAARLAGTPVVIASQRDMGDLRSRGQQGLHSTALGLATHVVVNSGAIAACLAGTRAARRGRLAMIRNGVDLARFTPVPEESRARRPVTVATLANLRPEKGLMQLVEAAAVVARRAPDARFVIWGDGPLRSDLQTLIRARGLSDIMEMPGPTREPEAALRRADVFVLSSLSEASSNVVLEAMATGLPVVATRVGGLPGLVDHEATGLLVPPGDVEALARAILRLLETPGLAATMGVRGRARAVAEFGLDRLCERVDSFYCWALGPAQGAPAPREAVPQA